MQRKGLSELWKQSRTCRSLKAAACLSSSPCRAATCGRTGCRC